RQAGAVALLNGDAGLAIRLGTGLHLRAAQLGEPGLAGALAPVRAVGAPIAASCHHAEDLAQAQRLECDFAVLGPVNATPTHPGAAGIGWDAFARLREGVSLPLYAIGALGPADIPLARNHGAQGIAAIRGLWG